MPQKRKGKKKTKKKQEKQSLSSCLRSVGNTISPSPGFPLWIGHTSSVWREGERAFIDKLHSKWQLKGEWGGSRQHVRVCALGRRRLCIHYFLDFMMGAQGKHTLTAYAHTCADTQHTKKKCMQTHINTQECVCTHTNTRTQSPVCIFKAI